MSLIDGKYDLGRCDRSKYGSRHLGVNAEAKAPLGSLTGLVGAAARPALRKGQETAAAGGISPCPYSGLSGTGCRMFLLLPFVLWHSARSKAASLVTMALGTAPQGPPSSRVHAMTRLLYNHASPTWHPVTDCCRLKACIPKVLH